MSRNVMSRHVMSRLAYALVNLHECFRATPRLVHFFLLPFAFLCRFFCWRFVLFSFRLFLLCSYVFFSRSSSSHCIVWYCFALQGTSSHVFAYHCFVVLVPVIFLHQLWRVMWCLITAFPFCNMSPVLALSFFHVLDFVSCRQAS